MEIDIKKIGAFLKSLNEAEFIYIEHAIDFAVSLRRMIRRHDLSKADVCLLLDISLKKYNDYICGNFNYSMRDSSRLNEAFIELESKLLEKNVPVQVNTEAK